tara:strand:- start:9462 stop:10481 length:1020 start_codon:yes stop_codon:yes gene_type:complete
MNSGTHCENNLSIMLSTNLKKKKNKSSFDLLQSRKGILFSKEKEKKSNLNKTNKTFSPNKSISINNTSNTQHVKVNLNSSNDIKKKNIGYQLNNNISIDRETLLLQHIDMLKNQLTESGIIPIDEAIPYEIGKENLQSAIFDGSEEEIERWDKFVRNHPMYIIEQEEQNKRWNECEYLKNRESYEIQKDIIPNIPKNELSIKSLREHGLNERLSKRIINNRCLLFIHMTKQEIDSIHIADLHYKYAFVSLDIVELRALFFALPDFFQNDPTNEKAIWKENLLEKLKSVIVREKNNSLSKNYIRNSAYSTEIPKEIPVKKINFKKSMPMDLLSQIKCKAV